MGFRCGIVELTNVGKSTLFNALTEAQAGKDANSLDPAATRKLDLVDILENAVKPK